MIFSDQINHRINLPSYPERIVSLVPSQTELLYDLGLENKVVGITKFCIYPNIWYKTKNRVGGTKNLNIDKIVSLQPDLIIANKEENNQDQIEQLQKLFPVYTSDISNLTDSLEMIQSIGQLTNTESIAAKIITQIEHEFKKLEHMQLKHASVLYLIWKDPYMSIGSDTFISDMLNRCGYKNVMDDELRYPVLSTGQIKELRPDLIFLSSEPFPFRKEHRNEIQKIVPDSKTFLVDGEYFSWYGSRLQKAVNYYISLIDNVN